MYVTLFWSIILILFRRENNNTKQYLGVFMFTAFLLYLTHAVFFNGQRSAYIYFEPLYTLTSLLVYPLYYIYIKTLCGDISFKSQNLFLFLPQLSLLYSHYFLPSFFFQFVLITLHSTYPFSLFLLSPLTPSYQGFS